MILLKQHVFSKIQTCPWLCAAIFTRSSYTRFTVENSKCSNVENYHNPSD